MSLRLARCISRVSGRCHYSEHGQYVLTRNRIPFERALEFANKEKITEQLYPLFVHDIGALLYHPSNQTRASVGSAAMAAVDRNRRPDQMQTHQRYLSGPAASQPPSLHHHHPFSITHTSHTTITRWLYPAHSRPYHPIQAWAGPLSTELTPSPLLLQVPRASWAWATKAALMSGTVATSKTLRAVSHCQLTPD